MTAATWNEPDAAASGRPEVSAETVGHTLGSIPEMIAELADDALELLALEGRAAALTMAMLVFVCVAGACFALFAWLGLSGIGVVLLVDHGYSWAFSLAVLAAVNAALAAGAGLMVRRLTRSILFRGTRESRDESATARN
jgi:uncharacterized membrane protein YqjE